MAVSFDNALEIAKTKYPHEIKHYEEYKDYFVFDSASEVECVGGDLSPIVIRKEDGVALNYAPIFFNLDADAEDVGEPLFEGKL